MKLFYVRFGLIPKSGKSYNYLNNFEEVGVSVYEALYDNGSYRILLPKLLDTSINTLGMCFNVAQCLSGQLDRKTCLYLVDGEKIGEGSDGEPLLKDCTIIKPIFEKEINEWKQNNE